MDLLNDFFKHAGFRSWVWGHRSFSNASLEFPCPRSLGFHIVTQGEAFIHRSSREKPIALKRGDIAFMARGCRHIISTEGKLSGKLTPVMDFDELEINPEKPKLTIASGAYQVWNLPVHPFFSEIPDWLVIRHEEIETFDRLQTLIALLSEEVSKKDLGSERIVQGLIDIMFSLIVRKIVKQNSNKAQTWSYASQDSSIRKSLEALHADISKNWSLEELAKHAGLSRAGFALKFKKAMGDTPLHYLTVLRIQSAMQFLSTTELNVESIAYKVGYNDAFSFSKSFKKITGIPPREFRVRDRKETESGWRV